MRPKLMFKIRKKTEQKLRVASVFWLYPYNCEVLFPLHFEPARDDHEWDGQDEKMLSNDGISASNQISAVPNLICGK